MTLILSSVLFNLFYLKISLYFIFIYNLSPFQMITNRVCSDRERDNGFKLKKDAFKLDIRKKFFTIRMVKHRHRFSRGVLNASSLETFKTILDGALNNQILLTMSLLILREVELDGLYVSLPTQRILGFYNFLVQFLVFTPNDCIFFSKK